MKILLVVSYEVPAFTRQTRIRVGNRRSRDDDSCVSKRSDVQTFSTFAPRAPVRRSIVMAGTTRQPLSPEARRQLREAVIERLRPFAWPDTRFVHDLDHFLPA